MFGHINHLVLKVTRDCNLRCEYCYIKDKDSFKGEVITIEVIKKIIERLVFDKKKNKDRLPVNVTLHGGEPTKIGKNNLYKIFEYISTKLTSEGISFQLSMQTNLTLVDEETAIILSKFKVSIGFSFDGIKSNKLRTKSYTDDFFIEKMKMLSTYRVSFSPLIVITRENYRKIFNTLNFLEKEFNIKNIRLNYAEDVSTVGKSSFEVNGKKFFKHVWKRVLDDYISGKSSYVYETNVERIVRKFVFSQLDNEQDKETGNCGLKFCGGGMRVIEVEPDGNVSYCGRYSESFDVSRVGNVSNKEFLDVNSYMRYFDFLKAKDEVIRNTRCDTCPAKSICDYGCMAFHYSKYGKWGVRKDLVCDLFIPMHNYMYKHRDVLIKKTISSKSKNGKLDLKLGKKIIVEDEWK